MSLVAYATSDESGSSDEEETSVNATRPSTIESDSNLSPGPDPGPTQKSKRHQLELETDDRVTESSLLGSKKASVHSAKDYSKKESQASPVYADDDVWEPPAQGEASGLHLPPPKHATDHPDSENIFVKIGESHVLSKLPVPHASLAKSAGGTQEEELEDIVKPKPSQLADVLKPPPAKKPKKIQIALPSLPDVDSSDEEEESPKQHKPATQKSGLFALLPQPKSALKKSTAFIPHTLTKRAKTTSKPTSVRPATVNKPNIEKKTDSATPLTSFNNEDSDEEGDYKSDNFFSLGDGANKSLLNVQKTLPQKSVLSLKGINTVPSVIADNCVLDSSGGTKSREDTNTDVVIQQDPKGTDNDAGNLPESPLMDAPLAFKGPVTSYGTSRPQSSIMPYYPDAAAAYDTKPSGDGEVATEEVQQFVQDEQFLRMQGKRQRGEAINIIDINADDQLEGVSIELTKQASEETQEKVSRKKGDGPTSQQKRKHQITWLAHQAKEREVELKNSWATNRQTRRQTQAKYGF